MDTGQAIIVKKIKKAGHGHHGGGWKVAFADFAVAMMAFFLLMWLVAAATPEEKAAIADFFENPSAVQGPGGASTSMIKLGGEGKQKASGKSNHDKNFEDSNPEPSKADADKKFANTEVEDIDKQKEAERLDSLKQDLEKAIEASQALKPFKDQLLLDITAECLRIQIIDAENRPMFTSGSSRLQPYTLKILKEIAVLIAKVPNKISLTGHTDARPFRNFAGDTNWELSANRANASRRALVKGGLAPDKIAKVVGLSSTVLFDKENPHNSINRRISLIVMNKESEDLIVENASAAAGKIYGTTYDAQKVSGSQSPSSIPKKKPKINMLGASRRKSTQKSPTKSSSNKSLKLQTF